MADKFITQIEVPGEIEPYDIHDTRVDNIETEIDKKIENAKSDAKSYTDATVGGVNTKIDNIKTLIGTIPESSTVIGEIEKKVSTDEFETFKTSNTAAINKAKTEADENADNKITAKVGTIGSKTVKEYVDDVITAAAPADYDTVKTDVATNKSAISTINNTSTGILAQAKNYTNDKIKEISIPDTSTFALKSDITSINTKITTINSNISSLQTKDTTLENQIKTLKENAGSISIDNNKRTISSIVLDGAILTITLL